VRELVHGSKPSADFLRTGSALSVDSWLKGNNALSFSSPISWKHEARTSLGVSVLLSHCRWGARKIIRPDKTHVIYPPEQQGEENCRETFDYATFTWKMDVKIQVDRLLCHFHATH